MVIGSPADAMRKVPGSGAFGSEPAGPRVGDVFGCDILRQPSRQTVRQVFLSGTFRDSPSVLGPHGRIVSATAADPSSRADTSSIIQMANGPGQCQ